ncbi:MAG: hypothetical protein HC778_00095 [Chamaesiphon sp. CSU_1_12]|nr:hypothetical protein [Chamaesiphon sp. CSU_1_12]
MLKTLIPAAIILTLLSTQAQAQSQCITKRELLTQLNNNREALNLPILILEPKLPTNLNQSSNTLRSLKVGRDRSIGYKTIVKILPLGVKPNISIGFGLDRYVNVDTKPISGDNCRFVVTYGELFNLAPN